MSALQERFEDAAARVTQLPGRPDNADLLRLYALYKQGSSGDVSGDRPGMIDFVGRAKYDAWADLAGTPRDEAQRGYVELVEQLEAAGS